MRVWLQIRSPHPCGWILYILNCALRDHDSRQQRWHNTWQDVQAGCSHIGKLNGTLHHDHYDSSLYIGNPKTERLWPSVYRIFPPSSQKTIYYHRASFHNQIRSESPPSSPRPVFLLNTCPSPPSRTCAHNSYPPPHYYHTVP